MSEFFFPIDRQYYPATTRVRFSAFEHSQSEYLGFVDLHCPRNLTFGDNANYNNFDLGALSSVGEKAFDGVVQAATGKGFDKLKGLGDALGKGAIDSWRDKMGAGVDTLVDAGMLTADTVGKSRIRDLLSYKSKRAVNPNTNTLYNSVSIRKFNFSFSLIARDAAESDSIKGMVDFFRQYTYPEVVSLGMIAKFPPFWRINFYHGDAEAPDSWWGVQDNKYIPIIHDCFLESFSSSHNTEANSWHSDGSPFDVSISLGFTETKTYDQKTILIRGAKDT